MASKRKAKTGAKARLQTQGHTSITDKPEEEPLPGTWAGDLARETVEWFVRPWIPKGELTIISGAPNAGKSTFGAYLMGHAWATVVLGGKEESFGKMGLSRLQANNVDPMTIRMLNDQDYRLPDHRDRILRVVERLNADLLWIDPLDNYLGDTADIDGQGVRAFLEAFTYIAHKTGCSVVGVRHPGKNPNNFLPGARTWHTVPRMVLRLLYDQGPPEQRICYSAKDSCGKLAKPTFVHLDGEEGQAPVWRFGDPTPRGTLDFLSTVTDNVERWKVDQAEQFLRAYLADGQQDSRDIYRSAESERLNDRCIRRAAERIGVEIRREGSGKDHKSMWSIPASTPVTPDS